MDRRRLSIERVVPLVVTAAVASFVLWQFFPSLLLTDSTPVKGDLGPHLHEPALLRDQLLPALSGWSQDWFTGYPSLVFYFPLGSALVVLLDALLPYNVAFKLVAAAGPVALPVAAYVFGRLVRRERSEAACYAVATLPLLLHPWLYTAGGAIGSAAIGEYSYSLSLALGLVVVGLGFEGLRTGRHRVLTSVLLAGCLLLHLLPTVGVVLGIVVSGLFRPTWAKVRWAASVLVGGVLLAGFWLVPFVLRNRFTTGPDYPRIAELSDWLFPALMLPIVFVAGATALVAIGSSGDRRDELGAFMATMAVVSAVLFAVTPSGRVWNARFLPLWFLWVCLLAGHGTARVAHAVDRYGRRGARTRSRRALSAVHLATPAVLLVALLPLWDSRLGVGLLTRNEVDFRTIAMQFVEGYERSEHRTEVEELVETLRTLGRDHGCGRAHWEYEDTAWTDIRSGIMQLLPYWTKGCIASTEGLYQQAAATSRYVHHTNARLSPNPAPFMPDQPSFDLARGLEDLRILGVRYFFAANPVTQQAADSLEGLRHLGETNPHDGRFWKIYEVDGVDLVEPLTHVPVVVRGIGGSRLSWESAALRWYDGDARDVLVAADGPGEWDRRDSVSSSLPREAVTPVAVDRVRIGRERMSFRVSEPGTPVLVKVSYFPNWRAEGARGPWRVAPNQMVVIPDAREVTLHYRRTAVDNAGLLVSVLGVVFLVFVTRRRRISGF